MASYPHDVTIACVLILFRRAYFEVDSQDNDYQSRDHQNRSDNPLYYR